MAERITSRENPVVKLCRKLQSSARARREEGLFVAEGARLCREALAACPGVRTVLATPEALEKNPWLQTGEGLRGAELLLIAPEVAGAVSDTKTPQGVFCLCPLPEEEAFTPDPGGRYLLLDRLQDPGNLGTIIRGAEAFGVAAVVLSPGCPDRFSPKVLRGTMGSVFRQPVYTVPHLVETVRRMRGAGISLWAAALDPGAAAIGELGRRGGGIGVVIGNEGNGVTPEVLAACGASVYIPMSPAIESLNAAAAATVIMWEIAGKNR